MLLQAILNKKDVLGPAFAGALFSRDNPTRRHILNLDLDRKTQGSLIEKVKAIDRDLPHQREATLTLLLETLFDPTTRSRLSWEGYFANPKPEFIQDLVLEGGYAPFPDSEIGRERYAMWRRQILHMDAMDNTRFLLICDIMQPSGHVERVFRKFAKVLYHDKTEEFFTGDNWAQTGAVEEEDVDIVEDSSSGVMKELIGGRRVIRMAFRPFMRTRFRNSTNFTSSSLRNTCGQIDLSHAQIGHGESDELKQEHCLIHSLRYYGVDEDHLNTIAMRLISENRTHVTQRDFKMIASFLNVRLVTKSMDKSMGVQASVNYYGEPTSTVLKFGIVKNHIFPNIDLSYTLCYVKNLDKIERYYEEYPNDNKARRTSVRAVVKRSNHPLGYRPRFRSEKEAQRSKKPSKVSTLLLIATMFEEGFEAFFDSARADWDGLSG